MVNPDQIQSQIDTSLAPLVSKMDSMSQNFETKVDQIADLVKDISKIHLAIDHGVTQPSFDDSEECEVNNVLTHNQCCQNLRTYAKMLCKPEPGTPYRQKYTARQQYRLPQYTWRFRNIADNIASQAAAQARPAQHMEPVPTSTI